MKTATDQPFKNLSWQLSKVMDQLQKGYYNFCPSETWTPNVNLYETDADYLVCVDLSGVDKEKIELVAHAGQLTIRGTRGVPTMDQASDTEPAARRIRVHLMEIDHGAFCREVELPQDVAEDRINATYRNGLLWIQVPKK